MIEATRPSTRTGRTAIVLGAGIQGTSAALALRHAGWDVELIDRGPEPLLGASLRGEGKLHLGYVYGNEVTRATAGLMIEGALSFAANLDRWLPRPLDWPALRSEPFRYAILADTMVAPEDLAAHYRWVDDILADRLDQGASYAGRPGFTRTRRVSSVAAAGFGGDVIAAYDTSEVAIDPALLRQDLIAALDAAAIPFRSETLVRSVARTPHGFAVEVTEPGRAVATRHADAVVNCLWDGRLAVDATMGLRPTRPCLYRFKVAVHGRLDAPAAAPLTTTFALGPYGDVVRWADGRVYLSWYPAGLVGISRGLEPPAEWQALRGDLGATADGRTIAAATVAALGQRLEPLRAVRVEAVAGGIIVAWGESDIDVPNSALHGRHAIGVHDHDGYLSVDTGKFTTAPLFAAEVARVLGPGHGWTPS